MSHNFKEIRDFISDCSELKINGKPFGELFHLEGTPVDWFIRPILFSSLLPAPFRTIDDYINGAPACHFKVSAYRQLFKVILPAAEQTRWLIAKKKRNQANKEDQANSSSLPRIMFFTFSNYYAGGGLPFREQAIINRIKREKKCQAFTLAAEPLSSFSPTKLLKIDNTIYDYYELSILKTARQWGKRLASLWRGIPAARLQEHFRHEDKDLYGYFRQNFDFLYSRQFLTLIACYYLVFKKIIIAEKIKSIVVSSQNNILEKCLIAAARKADIPVIVIQHGIALGLLPTIDTPPNVKFAVFGEAYKEMLISLKVPPDNISVVGPIILDGIEKYVGPNKLSEKNILLATSPMIEDRYIDKCSYFSRCQKILLDLQRLNPTRLTLKLHPREKFVKEYRRLVASLKLKAEVISGVDRDLHYSIIKESDLVVSFGSTVALEAMIIGRPSLAIDIFDKNNPTNKAVINSGATAFVKYSEDLAKVARELLKENTYRDRSKTFVQSLCYQLDGRASERITEFIYSIVAEQKRDYLTEPKSGKI